MWEFLGCNWTQWCGYFDVPRANTIHIYRERERKKTSPLLSLWISISIFLLAINFHAKIIKRSWWRFSGKVHDVIWSLKTHGKKLYWEKRMVDESFCIWTDVKFDSSRKIEKEASVLTCDCKIVQKTLILVTWYSMCHYRQRP